MKLCENCNNNHGGTYGSGRFCNAVCARGFSTRSKRAEISQKVSARMTGRELTLEHRVATSRGHGSLVHRSRDKNCVMCNAIFRQGRKFCSVDCMKSHTKLRKTEFEIYRVQCRFNFDVYELGDKFDLTLPNAYGWYSASNRGGNLDGVSRDHMISVRYGFDHSVPAEMIAHPANCELVLQRDNSKKRAKCSISVDELKRRIAEW